MQRVVHQDGNARNITIRDSPLAGLVRAKRIMCDNGSPLKKPKLPAICEGKVEDDDQHDNNDDEAVDARAARSPMPQNG